MMPLNPEAELEALQKRIVFLSIMDTPGLILIGLGLFGKFEKNPEGLHPILANSDATTVMLAVGGVIAAWCLIETLKAIKRRAEIAKQLNA